MKRSIRVARGRGQEFSEPAWPGSDGRIGAQTLADLNVPLRQRVRQMQLTLERWRWMPDAYQKAPIVVNIPEFRLRAYDENSRSL